MKTVWRNCCALFQKKKKTREDPLRSYSLVSAIVCLFVLFIVLKFVDHELVTTFHNMNKKII